MTTLASHLSDSLRTAARAFALGDQVAPAALLWPDPERLWERVLPQLKSLVPELFALGDYRPLERTGPALWLRCLEGRALAASPPVGTTPIFYLPGVSREQLRRVEECPVELTALVELQFRGTVWSHANGRDWTPYAYLVTDRGGLGLDVAKDHATLEALAGALPAFASEPLVHLAGRRLDAEFFNELVSPDAAGLILRWLSDPVGFRQQRAGAEWNAFCQQCKADFRCDPEKNDLLAAAQSLAGRAGRWGEVWQRYSESPANYPGIVPWLERAAPKVPSMFDTAAVWPTLNKRDEQELQLALQSLVDRPQDEVILGVGKLEEQHAERRRYPWQKLGLSPLATALAPLARLARLCESSPGAASPDAFAEYYVADGWQVDAASIATMAACGSLEQHGCVLSILRALYLPWLESTSRHLQQLIRDGGEAVAKRAAPIEASSGRVVLFADGLRLDVAQSLAQQLERVGLQSSQEWDWSTIPSVTATAKPAASPLSGALQGGEAGVDFATRFISNGQAMTQPRLVAALQERGWQCLRPTETGDTTGSAWTESGTLDKRGHDEGWKLARAVEGEVRDLASRISALLRAGWNEVIVVTDHGWLLLPGGLPKVELKAFLTENRWGRCAALKPGAHADPPTFKWHWNTDVTIASPPGVGCYRASMEYSHGGVSLQEMVTPRLRVTAVGSAADVARLLEAKWTGAKCRVVVGGEAAGCRVDIRLDRSDPLTSILADAQSREVTAEGKVTLFLEHESDIGKNANLLLLDPSGQVIDSMTTLLGE